MAFRSIRVYAALMKKYPEIIRIQQER